MLSKSHFTCPGEHFGRNSSKRNEIVFFENQRNCYSWFFGEMISERPMGHFGPEYIYEDSQTFFRS